MQFITRPRRRPPFGARVAEILSDPERLVNFSGCTHRRATIWIATGRGAWEWAKARPHHLVAILPVDSDPAKFDWRFLAGHEPILLQGPAAVDTHQRRAIARAAMRDGVSRVLAGAMLMRRAPKAAA